MSLHNLLIDPVEPLMLENVDYTRGSFQCRGSIDTTLTTHAEATLGVFDELVKRKGIPWLAAIAIIRTLQAQHRMLIALFDPKPGTSTMCLQLAFCNLYWRTPSCTTME